MIQVKIILAVTNLSYVSKRPVITDLQWATNDVAAIH
jgi:hypothetical protein